MSTLCFTKRSDERLNYTFDWAAETSAVGSTITTSAITVPAGLTLYSESNDTTTATAYIEGGTHGEEYYVSCEITTSDNLVIEEGFILKIEDSGYGFGF